MLEQLQHLIAHLRLHGMAQTLEPLLERAETEALPVTEVLRMLFQEEWRHRQERSLAYRISQAKLPWHWSLETFPFAQQPGVNAGPITAFGGRTVNGPSMNESDDNPRRKRWDSCISFVPRLRFGL